MADVTVIGGEKTLLVPQLFPLAGLIFTTGKGITMSEAQRRKELNKNHNDKDLETLKGGLYNERQLVISASKTRETTVSLTTRTIKPENFNVLKAVAGRNQINAWLGQAINYRASLEQEIIMLDDEDIAEAFGFECPTRPSFFVPKKKSTKNDINRFCSLDKAEDLIRMASKEVLEEFGIQNISAMLAAEANAAVYGKQCNNSQSWLRRLMSADQQTDGYDKKADGFLFKAFKVLRYKKSDFEAVEKEIMETYTEYQRKRNSYFKQLKDIARRVQMEYDAEYTKQLEEYQAADREYNNAYKIYSQSISDMRTKLVSELASYKIIETPALTK